MTIKVKVGGFEIEVETLDQAAGLVQRLKGQTVMPHEPINETHPKRIETPVAPVVAPVLETALPSAENKWATLIGNMNEKQRRVIAYVKAHDGATLQDVSAAIAEGRNVTIAGWLTGVVRHAKKAGIKVSSIYRSEHKGSGPKRVIRYYAGPLLRANEVPE